VKTRCSAATDVLQVTKDHERHRVMPRVALIDRVGALSGATRSVQPARSDRAQVVEDTATSARKPGLGTSHPRQVEAVLPEGVDVGVQQ